MQNIPFRSDSPYVPRPIAPAQADTSSVAFRGATRKFRILIACFGADPVTSEQGPVIRALSRALADTGHDIELAAGGMSVPGLDERVRVRRLPALGAHLGRLFGKLGAMFFSFHLIRLIRRADPRFDIVIDSHGLLGHAALKRLGLSVMALDDLKHSSGLGESRLLALSAIGSEHSSNLIQAITQILGSGRASAKSRAA